MIFTRYFFLILFFLPFTIMAQNSTTIYFNKDFNKVDQTKKIPFGEKILFKGDTLKSDCKKLTVEINHGINTQIVDAVINDKGWSAIVGPFDQNQNVIIKFNVINQLSEIDWENIISSFKKVYEKITEDLVKENKNWKKDELIKEVISKIKSGLDTNLKNYKTQDGKNAYDIILNDIYTKLNYETIQSMIANVTTIDSSRNKFLQGLSYIENQIENIETLKDNNKLKYTEWAKVEIKKYKSDSTTSIAKAFENLFVEINNKKLNISKIKDDIDIFKGLVSDYNDAAKALGDTVKQIFLINELVKQTTFNDSESSITDIDVSGIQRYVGVDMGGLAYESGKAVVGGFILLSPYWFSKIDTEEDLKLKLWSDIFKIITPTVGMLVVPFIKSDNLPTTFFVGGSIRLNRIIRITSGDAFFTNINGKFTHCWANGISINVSNLGSLLKIIGGSTSNFKP